MTFKRTSLVFALASIVATQLAGCAAEDGTDDTDETTEALTSGRIVVKQFGSPGATLGKWGYDIKQPGRSQALKPALANEIFNDIGMNLLRIAVRATDGHPSQGVDNIKGAAYADDLEAIKNAKAAKPSIDIFASLKLLGDKSFPGWVKDGGEVNAAKYAELLQNYLAFMKSNGVTVDWLGIDCERKFNEGNITPAKYNKIVDDVTAWCKSHGVKVPGFIAAEDYGPTEDTGWLQDLWASPAKFSNVDHVGVHIYSKHRNAGYVDAMQKLANNSHGKGLWDSELHWNDLDENGGTHFEDVKPGILAAMDHFDLGFHALSWWAFQPRSMKTKSAYIMSELVSSTIGASTLPTDDMDGKEVTMSKFNSCAFKNNAHEVTLWVANFDNKDQKNQVAEIANQTVTSAAYVQWSPNSADAGKTGSASINTKNASRFSMNYPANTITRVTVTVK
jgi:O-glycosyl hydrolase